MLEEAGYDVLGEACSGASAIAATRDLDPAIVLLDIYLPDLDGFEVARQITGAADPPAVVLISSRDTRDFTGMIAASGARGFVSKADLSAASLAAILN